jgi:hypothetical protein
MIEFRDRALKPNERSHYVCTECGCELHPDMAYSHKCNSIASAIIKYSSRGGLR